MALHTYTVFNVALAPYRIDFFNSIAELGKTSFYFTQKEVEGSPFSLEQMTEKCKFVPQFLKTIHIMRRNISMGIWKVLRRDQPACVFIPEYSFVSLAVCLYRILFRKKFKVICVCDDSIDMIKGNEFSRMHAFARRIIVPMCDELVLLDKQSCEWYKAQHDKGIWFPLIRDEHQYIPVLDTAKERTGELVQEYNLEDKRIVLYVGRLIALKNVSSIIKAMQEMPENTSLVVVGDGEELENLQRLSTECNVPVLFVGWQSGIELLSWYRIAHVLILASTREPFGAVVNEALLAGCRVCVSQRAGSACLVCANNGTVFDPNKEDELKKALRRELELSPLQKEVHSLMPVTYQSCRERLKNIL